MKKILKILLWLAILFVSFFVIASTFGIFGYRIFSVQSGSMEPKIKTGSLVLVKDKADYKKGDIVTFKTEGSKDTTTHRITGVQAEGLVIFYETKGDANNASDNELLAQSNIIGSVRISVPYLGYLVSYIKTLPGLIILIIVPAVIIIYEEMRSIKKEIQKARSKRNSKKKNVIKQNKVMPKKLDTIGSKKSKKEVQL